VTSIAVLRAGPLTTVQDHGRPGLAHLGVPPSGALDLPALDLGNLAVGNPRGTAALEATLHGPALRFEGNALVAVTGAECGAVLAGRPLPRGRARAAAAGDVLELGRCTAGVRAYVCVRGGIDVEPTLGSRATDLLTGLGPPPLRDGDELRVGPEPPAPPRAVGVPPPPPRTPVLRVLVGPRDDWLAPGAVDALLAERWRVTPASNRVGIRLDGAPLARARPGELLSEGMVSGAVQVPPSGRPILLLADHPTTGGYPVVAVVVTRDLPLAGQLAPGDEVRFPLDPETVP
jgi:biotin-dependent carboxylase-like uncharacterized protein